MVNGPGVKGLKYFLNLVTVQHSKGRGRSDIKSYTDQPRFISFSSLSKSTSKIRSAKSPFKNIINVKTWHELVSMAN